MTLLERLRDVATMHDAPATLGEEAADEIERLNGALADEKSKRAGLPVCEGHRDGDLDKPSYDGLDCIHCRVAYLEAQETLLQEWQDRAKAAEERADEVTRPLDAQMARLNERVVELNGENHRLLRALGRLEPYAVKSRDLMARCRTLVDAVAETCEGDANAMALGRVSELLDQAIADCPEIGRQQAQIIAVIRNEQCDQVGVGDCSKCGRHHNLDGTTRPQVGRDDHIARLVGAMRAALTELNPPRNDPFKRDPMYAANYLRTALAIHDRDFHAIGIVAVDEGRPGGDKSVRIHAHTDEQGRTVVDHIEEINDHPSDSSGNRAADTAGARVNDCGHSR